MKIGTGIVFVLPPLSSATAYIRRPQKANIKDLTTRRFDLEYLGVNLEYGRGNPMVESPTVAQEFYQPSELIHILSNWITRHRPAQTIRLRGIYQKKALNAMGEFYYDILKR